MHKLADSMRLRFWLSVAVGIIVEMVATALGHHTLGLMLGWIATAGIFSVSTWLLVFLMNPEQTHAHARDNDPTHGLADVVLVLACLASVVGLGLLLHSSSHNSGAITYSVVGVLGISASWAAVHTLFTLRYAYLYFTDPVGGIDFKTDEAPDYRDFAYFAFNLGMTFQVSDTNVATKILRRTILHHSLISYLLSTVVLASMVNLLIQLVAVV